MKNKSVILAILLLFIAYNAVSQIFVSRKPGDTIHKTVSPSVGKVKPDADRDDIPFIDYKPVTIWSVKGDTVNDYGYIRRNFTDQLLSVWNYPKRYYPASRTYALTLDGYYYRSVNTSNENYVFAQQVVRGDINLFMYRIIPQTNGWIEYVSADENQPGYSNYMIIEVKDRRGSWNQFGYYFSTQDDSSRLMPVSQKTLTSFASDYLSGTPGSKAEAIKYGRKNYNKETKILLGALMSVGMVGALFGSSDNRWIFMAGFPLGAIVGLVNKPHTLHYDDMVRIVEMHNQEAAGKQ